MAYVVTARRWRPQVFADLVGQEHISRTLSNAIRADRVAHAFLFTGLRGVGKTTAARILAKALNCEQGPTPEPCNTCTNCREITDGRAVDVLEIDGASNTGVDDVREIIENVRYRPAKSTHKIYIIDEVHMLSTNAFNALLKTLEEPPPHVKFIFATTDPQKLPATVQSRCQRYDFRRIPLGMVVERLRAIVAEQKLQISDHVLFTLAREGEGSMRDAQSLLDQITAGADGSVSDEDALAALGITDRAVLYELGAAIIERAPGRALEVLDRVHRLGCDMRRLARDLLEHFRNLAVTHVSDGKLLPELPDDELRILREQAGAMAPADADRCFRCLLQVDDEVGRAAYPKLVLEMALIRLATLEPLVPVDELVQRLDALAGRVPAAPAAVTAAPTAAQRARSPRGGAPEATSAVAGEAAMPVAATAVAPAASIAPSPAGPGAAAASEATWVGFRAFVQERLPALAAHLAMCGQVEVAEGTLEIEAPSGFRAEFLANPAQTTTIDTLAHEYFGRPMRAKIHAKPRAGTTRPEARPQPTAGQRAESVRSHPAVRAALEILDGDLAEVRQRQPRDKGDR